MDRKTAKLFTTLEKTVKYDQKVLIKMTPEQHFRIKKKALKYSAGNVSDWMRYAALTFDPSSPSD